MSAGSSLNGYGAAADAGCESPLVGIVYESLTEEEKRFLISADKMPHPHPHFSQNTPWLRAAVLGADDGIVSTAGLMMGVAAGVSGHQELDVAAVALAGISGLVAGALSMAVGEYISVASQRDSEAADILREQEEQMKGLMAQRRELVELGRIYVERGLPPELALQVAVELTKGNVVKAHARDELGIDITQLANPTEAAITSMLSFAMGSSIPLFSFILWPEVLTVIVSTVIALGLTGIAGAWLGGSNCFISAMRVLIGGTLAMAGTYFAGKLAGGSI